MGISIGLQLMSKLRLMTYYTMLYSRHFHQDVSIQQQLSNTHDHNSVIPDGSWLTLCASKMLVTVVMLLSVRHGLWQN